MSRKKTAAALDRLIAVVPSGDLLAATGNAEFLDAATNQIRSLEAENARLREALGEAIAEIEAAHDGTLASAAAPGSEAIHPIDALEIDRLRALLTRLRAAM